MAKVISDRERKRRQKAHVNKIKEDTPCADCKRKYPYYVMQFDHVRGVKEGNISTFLANRQFKKALEEIAKCEVVCANCHSIRTYTRVPKGADHPQYSM